MRAKAGALAAVLALTGAGVAVAAGTTTADRTIADTNGDDRLEYTAGDAYLTRDDLGTRSPGGGTGALLLTFGQLTDLHIVDEESPARVEFLDKVGPPFTSAYRPHEGMSTQVVDRMVRAMRSATSPVSGRGVVWPRSPASSRSTTPTPRTAKTAALTRAAPTRIATSSWWSAIRGSTAPR